MPPTAPRKTKLLRAETGVFFVSIALRLWVLSRFSELPQFARQSGDMKFYHEWALRILGGQWTDGQAFYGLPGYAYLLAGIYKVVGTGFPFPWFVIGALQSVAEAFTAVLIFKIAKFSCENERNGAENIPSKSPLVVAFLASLAYVTFVPAQTFSIILMPTAWLVCAFWFCVWRAMKGGAGKSLAGWFALGLLVG